MSTLFFIENPLLDIQVNVPDKALFDKYELPPGGACLANDKQQALYPELLTMQGVEFIPGGSALNSARATNYMLAHQGHEEKVTYFGSINDDEYGQTLEKALTDAKIKGNFFKGSGVQTGTCGVVVHEKERSLCANLSAACKYATSHLESNMADLQAAKIIYTTAFFITSNNEALQKVGKYAADNNVPLAYNLSATFLIQFNTKEVDDGLENADFVFANEDEADLWGKVKEMQSTDRKDIALALAAFKKTNQNRKRVAIVTQGALPVIVAYYDILSGEYKVKEYPIPHLEKDQIVDTNGAGDSFVGGFLSQLFQDKGIDKCIEAGIYLSREVVMQSGCKMPATCTYQ